MNLGLTTHPRVVAMAPPARGALEAYSLISGLGLATLFDVVRRSSRVTLQGYQERLDLGACIETFWHDDALAFFVARPRHPKLVALLDPSLHMLGWETFWRGRGWEPVFGTSRRDGKRAAGVVVEALRAGASTLLTPDGPGGPPHRLKRGVIHIARASGRPIVPVHLFCSRDVRLPSWDRKRLPLPGSSITLSYGAPIHVRDASEEAAAVATLEQALGC